MKQSRYNYLTKREGEYVLYNALSDKFLLINPDLADLFENSPVDKIEKIHPQFFQVLCQNGFLVNENLNEYEELLHQWDMEDNDESKFTLTVNPTLKCNLRCWYCYEDHDNPPQDLSSETLNAIKRFIESVIDNPKLKHFQLSFFGGEPFLRYNQVIFPLISYSYNLCKTLNKNISVNFTTNGVLITDKYIRQLSSFNIPMSFQITLDGNKTFHNSTRVGKNKNGTYSTIINNIRKLAEIQQTVVYLRCNYTANNLQSFADVATDLGQFPNLIKQRISVNFERIWQDDSVSDIVIPETLDWVMKKFLLAGYNVSNNDYVVKHRCYADSNRAIVINSDGKLFKCTARDFITSNSEGEILNDGSIKWNERHLLRLQTKGGSRACQTCIIFPICGASCSQNRLERLRQTGCLLDRNSEAIRNILEKRINSLIDISLKHLTEKKEDQSGRG